MILLISDLLEVIRAGVGSKCVDWGHMILIIINNIIIMTAITIAEVLNTNSNNTHNSLLLN